jgi:hypothetical protein
MPLTLRLLEEIFAICRLSAAAPLPLWVGEGPFFSITRTAEELSLVVVEESIPRGERDLRVESGWRALMVVGPLDFALTGVLSAIATPLADAGIPIFVISTFDTDYVLVKQENVVPSIKILRDQGYYL